MILEIHPNYIEKKGKKEFVVISYDEFKRIEETLNDYEDLMALRKVKSKEKDKSTKNIDQVKKELNIS
jgi:PHD/YefM family antitoxin component YafN of YafNO toxin-antitoxin module